MTFDVATIISAIPAERLSPLAAPADVYYTPRTMAAADGTVEGGLDAETVQSSAIYTLYDALVTAHPTLITRTTLGLDASGTLNIYKYVFAPAGYVMTVILGANIHGPGVYGDPRDAAITVYNFMEEICNHYSGDVALTFLHDYVRFVVMPVQNPWGFNNGNRWNSNSVDINRNADYRWLDWTPTEYTPKGAAPFSEIETRHIRDTLLAYPAAIAYFDFHARMDDMAFEWSANGLTDSPISDVVTAVAAHLGGTAGIYITTEPTPLLYAYAFYKCGIQAGNPEYVVYATTKDDHGAVQMTDMLSWYGNIVWRWVRAYVAHTY